jgi:N-acetylglucosaminyldiphosphoundecaprenol N-acetyl-beta-D-mannosaminyltransferase
MTTNQPQALSRRRVISLDLTTNTYNNVQEEILTRARKGMHGMICFANAHMAIEAQQKPAVAQAMSKADWIVTDGVPLIWALKSLYGIQQERIAGMDMMPSLLSQAARENLPVFLFGSTPDMLERFVAVCEERFPGLTIAGVVSPPFRPATDEEDAQIARQITDSGARLVFVALGCPKQELWMARMRERIPAVLLGIGGALPLLVGETKRAPLWIRQMGMEWMFRLMQEPQRLLKRYVTTNSQYIWYLSRQFLAQKRNG